MDFKDLKSTDAVGGIDNNFAVETTWPAQRRIKHIGDVGCPDDDNLAAGPETIHQDQKLGHNPLFDIALSFRPFGTDSVDFIDK